MFKIVITLNPISPRYFLGFMWTRPQTEGSQMTNNFNAKHLQDLSIKGPVGVYEALRGYDISIL